VKDYLARHGVPVRRPAGREAPPGPVAAPA
jgi:hypothetical protein